jgi:aldehyde:ferredoxin oxidoreductase
MDIKYIGLGQAGKVLVYYVTDYITKNNLAIHVGLGALFYAMKANADKYEGDADVSRAVKDKSLFTKTVNTMMARQEMSHQQVLSYIVGCGDHYHSHSIY